MGAFASAFFNWWSGGVRYHVDPSIPKVYSSESTLEVVASCLKSPL